MVILLDVASLSSHIQRIFYIFRIALGWAERSCAGRVCFSLSFVSSFVCVILFIVLRTSHIRILPSKGNKDVTKTMPFSPILVSDAWFRAVNKDFREKRRYERYNISKAGGNRQSQNNLTLRGKQRKHLALLQNI